MADSAGDLEREFELVIQQLRDDLQDLRKRQAAGTVEDAEVSSKLAFLRALREAERKAPARRPNWPTNTCWAFANMAMLDVGGAEGDERHVNADSVIQIALGADHVRPKPTKKESGVFKLEGDFRLTEVPSDAPPEELFKDLGQ
jgi:hypothetical protein